MEALGAGCLAFLGRAAAQRVVVAALGAHAGLCRAHVTWATRLLGLPRGIRESHHPKPQTNTRKNAPVNVELFTENVTVSMGFSESIM